MEHLISSSKLNLNVNLNEYKSRKVALISGMSLLSIFRRMLNIHVFHARYNGTGWFLFN